MKFVRLGLPSVSISVGRNKWPIKARNGKINRYPKNPIAAHTARHALFISLPSTPMLCRAPVLKKRVFGVTNIARQTFGSSGKLEPSSDMPCQAWQEVTPSYDLCGDRCVTESCGVKV
jgi:hypothetical protein